MKKSNSRKSKAIASVSICTFHQDLCNDISAIKTASSLIDQKLTSTVGMLTKHDTLLYGGDDPKKGLFWKWEANSVKIAILIFILTSIIGYFSGNGVFPSIIKFLLRICGLS